MPRNSHSPAGTQARKKPYTLGDQTYAGRAELKQAVQDYIGGAPLNVALIFDRLPYDILDQHPHREEKVGVGLSHVEIRLTEYGNRGFYAVRVDDTAMDFSWRVALGFAKSGASLTAAAREEVYEQIARVPGVGGHVHHEGTPFVTILRDWVALRGGVEPELIHGAIHDRFAKVEDALSWRAYHGKHAVLRRLTVDEHRRLHGKGNGQ